MHAPKLIVQLPHEPHHRQPGDADDDRHYDEERENGLVKRTGPTPMYIVHGPVRGRVGHHC